MSVTFSQHKADPATHSFTLDLQQFGMKLTMLAGNFTAKREKYRLFNDEEHEFAVDPDDRDVSGWMVYDTVNNEARFLVDEVKAGESPFDFGGSGYDPLFGVFTFKIPGGTTTLDAIDISVYHMVAPPEESEGV